MKTILVLAPHPELADAMRSGLNPEDYRVVHRGTPEEAEPLLAHGLSDVCVLDLELTGVQGIWVIERLQRKAANCPLLVYTGTRTVDWEEEAYLKGVKHVLAKPFRARLLTTVLDGLFSRPAPVPTSSSSRQFDTTFFGAQTAPAAPMGRTAATAGGAFHSLEILRDFSAILTHSLDANALLKQFLLMIREITGVNRAAIFLRPPVPAFMGGGAPADAKQMVAACAIGLASNLLENVQLSFEGGIAGHIAQMGRILRRNSPEAMDVDTQREFELLGAQVAIPLLDRERLLGVAVFDARVTGEPLANPELELIFHLLEQVGLAVKNIWLHDQVAGNHAMLADVMRELSSACVVVSRDLTILHANRLARKYFGQTGSRAGELEFSDLPAALGSKVFQVLKTGSALAPYRYSPDDESSRVYQVTISPIHHADSAIPASALLIVEDRTQTELLQKLERETSQLKADKQKLEQRRKIAERLAPEIGNAVFPLVVHADLFDRQIKDSEFKDSLKQALDSGCARITRRQKQLVHTAREGAICTKQQIDLAELIREAYKDALHHLENKEFSKKAALEVPRNMPAFAVEGEAEALKFALMEVILNGLQAGEAKPQVKIEFHATADSKLEILIIDGGPGFTAEAVLNAGTPFWMGTGKIVGLGLGLYVARKILESHGGSLEVPVPATKQQGLVKIVLPLAATSTPDSRLNIPVKVSATNH